MLEKKPFRKYNLKESTKLIFTIRLNEQERAELDKAKAALCQPKDSTAIKQLVEIGKIVLHQDQTGKIIELLFKNKQNNERLGIVEDPENFAKSNTKSIQFVTHSENEG